METLAQRVRILRIGHGWSMEDLAQRAKCSTATVWEIESGRKQTRPSNLYAIAKALDADPIEFARLQMEQQFQEKQ